MTTVLSESAPNIELYNAGAGTGAEKLQDEIARFNSQAQRKIAPLYADPVPGKSKMLAEKGRKRGIEARWYEGKIQDIINNTNSIPVAMNLDRPEDAANTTQIALDTGKALLGYILMLIPGALLLGLRMAFKADEKEQKQQAIDFFEAVSRHTLRSGSRRIFGAQGRVEHRMSEEAYRAWFATHLSENLKKVAQHALCEISVQVISKYMIKFS